MDKNYIFSRESTKIAKGLAILFMLGYHVFAFPERFEPLTYISLGTFQGENLEYWVGVFGKLCVAMFMVLAGYGTYISCGNKENIVNILGKKIKNLYFAYWKVFVIFVPIAFAMNVKRVEKSIYAFLMNFLGIKISYNGEWWFLTAFIITMLLYPLIRRWVNRKNANVFVDLLSIIFLSTFIQYVLPNIIEADILDDFSKTLFWRNANKLLEVLPQFLVGCIIAKYNLFQLFFEKNRNRWCRYAVSIIIIGVTAVLRKTTGRHLDYIYAPFVIIAAVSLIQDLKWLSTLFQKLGDQSTNMWLIHSFYCYHFGKSLIFSPKYSVLIFLWFVFISYGSGWALDLFYGKIVNLWKGCKP